MPEPRSLSVDDFIGELRIAPRWDIFQYYQEGWFELVVYYNFGVWNYASPSIRSMTTVEAKQFYQELTKITKEPTIVAAKIR